MKLAYRALLNLTSKTMFEECDMTNKKYSH